jgi:predicted nucleotidyltransferase
MATMDVARESTLPDATKAAVGHDTVAVVASEDLIEQVGQRLAEAATEPAKVILFGSHAQGRARPDSDLDLLVVERDLPDRTAEFVRLRRSLRGLGVPIDLILVSEANVDEWRDVPGTLIHDALREGRILAGA